MSLWVASMMRSQIGMNLKAAMPARASADKACRSDSPEANLSSSERNLPAGSSHSLVKRWWPERAANGVDSHGWMHFLAI
eukprot:14753810-Alexandrium_andersonii.AAC.1